MRLRGVPLESIIDSPTSSRENKLGSVSSLRLRLKTMKLNSKHSILKNHCPVLIRRHLVRNLVEKDQYPLKDKRLPWQERLAVSNHRVVPSTMSRTALLAASIRALTRIEDRPFNSIRKVWMTV